MKIGSIGYNYSHDKSFIMDKPCGVGCPLFLLVKDPSLFVINGEEQRVKAGSFVMLSPLTPCSYRAAEDTYTDDWMYFELTDSDIEWLSKLEIPFDTPVYLGNIEELSRMMHILAYEHYSAEICSEEIERLYMKILFLTLSRLIRSRTCISSASFIERNHRLTQLRTMIFTMPESVPDVGKMASDMGMSRSGFQHLYKKMFGASVMNEVIAARVERAKRLLSSTSLTVREIAERCGYSNEYNFMRQFKSRVGRTPTEYRRSL